MNTAFIQTRIFISYCTLVQVRMAGANTSVYEFDNVVRTLYIYELIDEILLVHYVRRYQRA